MQSQRTSESPYLLPANAADRPRQGIKKFCRNATAMAGLDDYRQHDNRYTHASQFVSSGLSLQVFGCLLGQQVGTIGNLARYG